MEAEGSCETVVITYRTTWYHNREDQNIDLNLCILPPGTDCVPHPYKHLS
jgi:hypothetical protein